METRIHTTSQIETESPLSGAVVYDGDGDGTSAAAIWLMDKPGDYMAITNQQKNDRKLVSKLLKAFPYKSLQGKEIGVFDLAAEQNRQSLEKLALSGANVDFIDHHTRDTNAIPRGIQSYFQPDARDNATAKISYDVAEQKGVLREQSDKYKATQLAIVGLANDGKGTAAQQFGKELINDEEREALITYAKAINFGSGSGILDSVELLKGLVKNDNPLAYLKQSNKINSLVERREYAINDLLSRADMKEEKGLALYVFPSETEEDRELSVGTYNEFMNTLMENDPTKTYVGLLQIPEGRWRISGRNAQGKALEGMTHIAEKYHSIAKGRNTAAGFDTAEEVNAMRIWKELQEVYENVI